MTLIHCHGAIEGRCDAKCYNARHADCHCICGGRNHGAGLERARENTRELAGDQLKAIEAKGGWIAPEIVQSALLQ